VGELSRQVVRPTDHGRSAYNAHVHRTSDNSTPDSPADPITTSVIRSYLDAFATGDADRIADHVADDFVNEHTAGLGVGCVGKASYRERLPGFLADMADVRYDIEDLVVDGDRGAAFYTMTASWQGAVPISVRGVQRLVVHDGLISHRTDYWDSAVFLTQADPVARAALAEFGVR
jgi:ketosteroid isomerase-like protein